MKKGVGIVIAASILLGAMAGIALGEPSAGFLIGLGAGLAAAIALTLFSGAGGRPR